MSDNVEVQYMFKVLIEKRHTIMTETKAELIKIAENGEKYCSLFFPFCTWNEDWEDAGGQRLNGVRVKKADLSPILTQQ